MLILPSKYIYTGSSISNSNVAYQRIKNKKYIELSFWFEKNYPPGGFSFYFLFKCCKQKARSRVSNHRLVAFKDRMLRKTTAT